jgi:hypothetical protein
MDLRVAAAGARTHDPRRHHHGIDPLEHGTPARRAAHMRQIEHVVTRTREELLQHG